MNGQCIRQPELRADTEKSEICANGSRLSQNRFVYIMMNKPAGVISSSDGRKTGEKTVVDILPQSMKRRGLFPAGRLDKDSTGLVLITDDGALAHDILSPKKHIDKTYIVRLDRPFDDETAADFERGMLLGDEKCLPAEISAENSERTLARVVLRQGMYHQIKRMFKKHSAQVLELHRVKMGALELDPSLLPGEARYLCEKELELLKTARGGEHNIL